MSQEEEIPEVPSEPPLDTDLYEILAVKEDATQDEIKSAYKRQALKHHPDKAPETSKDEANRKFQQIAFAYAILSDERRRRRFDQTGSTAEAFDDDDDFDWVDFYREAFSSTVDTNAIEEIKREYQGSEEEKDDVLAAFESSRGDMDRVYESVMLSNVLDDDERFRAIIDEAIVAGKVEKFKKYSEESEKKKQLRVKRAEKEAKEAEKLAKELDDKKETKGKKGKQGKQAKPAKRGGGGDMADLAAMIKQRQADRAGTFFDRLEQEYTAVSGNKRTPKDEPPEELFEANRRATKKKKQTKT